jgi:hypothetical protein
MKTLAVLFLWGGMLVACAGMALAADSKNIDMLPTGLMICAVGLGATLIGSRVDQRLRGDKFPGQE